MSYQGGHGSHHAMMVADFRKRFWISLIISIPILILSPLIQKFLGLQGVISFPGGSYVLFVLSSAVFFYGGWPFLKGIVDELRSNSPGMMTLIALAISVAYVYSSAVVFGVTGSVFFWELATGYNIIAIPLAAGVAYSIGIVLDPAAGAALMALSTIIVAINARFLRVEKSIPGPT